MMATERLTGLEILLLLASQVKRDPSSTRFKLDNVIVEVTVVPEDTSEAPDMMRPLRYHWISGLGLPKKRTNDSVMSNPWKNILWSPAIACEHFDEAPEPSTSLLCSFTTVLHYQKEQRVVQARCLRGNEPRHSKQAEEFGCWWKVECVHKALSKQVFHQSSTAPITGASVTTSSITNTAFPCSHWLIPKG